MTIGLHKRIFPALSILLWLSLGFTARAVEVGFQAPGFTLPALTGAETVSLADYKGKVVLLDFWASWCSPCRESFPLLDAMRKDLDREDFEILAINVDEHPEDAIAFLERYPVGYPMARSADGEVPLEYQLKSMPMSYLLDRDGKIVSMSSGFRVSDLDPLRREIEELLDAD